MTIGFSEPSTGSVVKAEELTGHLLIVRPLAHRDGINTVHGVKDAVEVDIDDVDTGESYAGALFFQGNLIGSFKGAIGTQLLGRITRGQAKAGQTAPFLFQSATSAQSDVDKATAFLTAKAQGSFAQPAASGSPTPEQIAAFLAAQAASQSA